jgi:uridylate kinase
MSAPTRVVLKISGESFAAPSGFGIDSERLTVIANEIGKASAKVDLAVVVGGGNIVRGGTLAQQGQIAQATADYMGMLGTVLNGLALREALEQMGHPSRLMSALAIPSVAEPFIRNRAIRHFEKGRILVLAAGTGNPFFTTDTCASLRAAELGADRLLKATKVDGIYDRDPAKHNDAVRYDTLSFEDAIEQQLGVMDLTALTMCMERKIPVQVFDFFTPGNIARAVGGEKIGTLVSPRHPDPENSD